MILEGQFSIRVFALAKPKPVTSLILFIPPVSYGYEHARPKSYGQSALYGGLQPVNTGWGIIPSPG